MSRAISKLMLLCALVAAPIMAAAPAGAANPHGSVTDVVATVDGCRYQAVFSGPSSYQYSVEGTFSGALGLSRQRDLPIKAREELVKMPAGTRTVYQVNACEAAKSGETLTKIQVIGRLRPGYDHTMPRRNDGVQREAATLPKVPAARPAGLTATQTGANEATVNWQPASGAVQQYQVRVGSSYYQSEVDAWIFHNQYHLVTPETLQYIGKLNPRAPEGNRNYDYAVRTVANGFLSDLENEPVATVVHQP
ncbi:hypothetical protein D5S17_23770 [Pseudonocardiaceae bacterium YIM PH 21723]|nr:hypothetical protein D5S17_23770 [Pseudonocardiaceae bacterium YIM PH 21723]